MRLVLIYLGKSIPKHFWQSTQHLLDLQSNYPIDIITSDYIAENPIDNPRVSYFVYRPSSEVTISLDELELDHSFRNGFWRFSLERLFAFTQHHEQFTNEPLLHIESDMLLLENFPFERFEKLEKLYWSKVDETRDIAALVYSPTHESSAWLHDKMLTIVRETMDIDDMRLLSVISRGNETKVSILPSTPKIISQLINQNLEIEHEALRVLCSEFRTFEGIFDPGGIGIWITGTDPRNSFGVTSKFDLKAIKKSRTYIDPSRIQFKFDKNSYLSFVEECAEIPIYSLHIHSKNGSYFKPGFEFVIEEDVKGSLKRKTKREFSLVILLNLIVHNWEKGTLLRFLSWLPVLRMSKKLRVLVMLKAGLRYTRDRLRLK
jgi:hypothetical protein